GFNDAEIAGIEKEIANKLKANSSLDAQTLVDEKISEKTPAAENTRAEKETNALGISEAIKPEAQQAGETTEETREAKDISNDVQSKYVALTEEGHETKGTVKPDAGEAIGWEVFFTSPKGTIAGDYFTIDLSENLSLKGIEPDHEDEYPIEIDGETVADGVRIDRSTIKYTFNEKINDQRHVVVSIKGFAYIDKTKVPNNSPEEKISIKLGDTVDEHNINVQYGKTYYTGENLNGMSQFTEFNPETGEYTQVFYINPDSKIIGTSTSDDWSANKVAVFIDGVDPKTGSQSDVKYTEDNTKITIHKLKSGEKLPDAIIENPAVNYDDPIYRYKFRDNGIELVFADQNDDKLPSDYIEDPYVVIVKSTAAPSQTGNNIISKGILYGGARNHTMYNDIVTTVGDTEAQGDKIGYFKEHHVYYTKVDGVLQEDKTFTLHSNKTEGYDYDTYFTNKNEIDDFKFVKVDTDKLVENPVYNTDGTIARGNYEPGKTKEVTYIYERDVKHGSFQEHHIYQTLDEDGNIIDEKTVTKDGTETTGIDENEYSTSKKDQEGNVVTEEIDKDGYKLVEVKATNDKSNELGVQFDGQGAATCGNYVNGEKLEVTYIYQKQKPVEKKGSFQEHHIYQTKKLNGTIVKDDEVNKDETSGTEKENYKTSKIDRKGYKLIEVKSTNGGQFNEDGSLKEAAYIADKKQEVTYIYQKEEVGQTPLEETGTFQEHHIYRTIDKDGNVTEEKVDGKVTGGTKDMTYTTGKVDKEGFTFVGTENPVENPTFSTEGESTTGKFKPGVKQEITYVYEKKEKAWTPIEETGKFQEHHIYRTIDKNGEVTEEKVDGKVTGGTKDMTYTTGKVDKEGFTFVGTENRVEEPSYNEKGETTKGNFKPGVKQEITYVYERTETPWTPLEPSEPVTPVEPEEPTTPVVPDQPEEPTTPVTPETPDEDPKETPWTPLEPSEPVEPEQPGEDPKEIPWTPLTPAEEVTPQTPEDNETPKEDSKETPKEGSKETSEKQTEKQSKKLPKAGADYELLQLAASALTLVSGMGISLSRKKRD
ncbi:MAG: Ig-like domain-containing protein, partial [Finegoldia magna]|nr:Ig-like domain-containing protein [Finegoldia magna]